MKKIIGFALALLMAVTSAVAAETQYEASQKITQTVVKGKLEQTVFAGDEIDPIRIVYENTGLADNESPKYSATNFLENFGLTEMWNGHVCEISGQMRGDIVAGTYTAYIVVKDNEGKFAKTEFKFIVNEKPIPSISLEWKEGSGPVDQKVNAGNSITPIIFDYAGITSYSVSGLPDGLMHRIDEKNQRIMIVGSVSSEALSGDHEYTVTVTNDQGDKVSKSGTITVNESKAVTSIRVVENETQKVAAGNTIKPVVFEFKNVRVSEGNFPFKDEGSLKGHFKYATEDNKLTVSGTVAENLEEGYYTIKIIAEGENNNDTAVATVDVTHNSSIVTKVSVLENATQSVSVGDSVKPIVFVMEHGSGANLTGFPGGFQLKTKGDTVTVIGLIEESAKGLYNVQLSVSGVNNNASAKATIDVAPGVMTFDLVEGSDNQSVVAGQEIVPIVYQYNHVKNIDGKGIPANLKVEQDKEKKQVKISGAVSSESATHEYTYTFNLTDYYDETMTVTGKVNVVAASDVSSSSNIASSSSATSSSSSAKSSSSFAKSSSSVASSSSSAPKSSSSVVSSSSWNEVIGSSSSAKSSSSSVVASSSSAKSSSSSQNVILSSSEASSSSMKSSSSSVVTSSSSVKSSSSSAKSSSSVASSSSSTPKSSSSFVASSSSATSSSSSSSVILSSASREESSSSSVESSSSEKTTKIVAVTMERSQFSYANNVLTLAQPTSSMVRVLVFDLTGHLVESFAESVVGSKSISLAHLNRGNYLVRVESNSMARTARIAVK